MARMATQPGSLRQVRERELVLATRALFDERGMQHAPIEEIAKAVGIARGLVYRHFSSKEELFVLTVTDYLGQLGDRLAELGTVEREPRARLTGAIGTYAEFCRSYPAFLDSALSLMHRPAVDLREMVSESVWLRLGQGMGRCVGHLIEVLRDGTEAGVFEVHDPDYVANVLWTQVLGTMHLARVGVGVREVSPGVPELFTLAPERVVQTCVDSALALVGEPR
jgi:AcrR family transcriptional regulator